MTSISELNELEEYGYIDNFEKEFYIECGLIDVPLYEDEKVSLKDKIKNSKIGKIASHKLVKDHAKFAVKIAARTPFIKSLGVGATAIGSAAKAAAVAHPGVAAGVAAAGAAYAGYKAYKHLKLRKKMLNAHKEAHNEAIKNIEKTHGPLAHALKPYVHDEIKKVVKVHKDEFKKNPQDIHKKIVDHFKSDDFKNKMLRRAGLGS